MELFQYSNTGEKKWHMTWLLHFRSDHFICSFALCKTWKKQESIIKSQHTRQLFIFILKVDIEIFLKDTVAWKLFNWKSSNSWKYYFLAWWCTQIFEIPNNSFLHQNDYNFNSLRKFLLSLNFRTAVVYMMMDYPLSLKNKHKSVNTKHWNSLLRNNVHKKFSRNLIWRTLDRAMSNIS